MILSVLNGIAIFAILLMALCGANRMSRSTRFQMRAGYVLAAVGAFAILVSRYSAPLIRNGRRLRFIAAWP